MEIYLDLPRNPEFNASSATHRDIAVAQLRANVLHLQSQLMLAEATIQVKDAVVQALNLTIYQQRQLLIERSGSDRGEKAADNDDEAILGDAIHVTTYEGKGFKVDLPGILRKLKRKFGPQKDEPAERRSLPPGKDNH